MSAPCSGNQVQLNCTEKVLQLRCRPRHALHTLPVTVVNIHTGDQANPAAKQSRAPPAGVPAAAPQTCCPCRCQAGRSAAAAWLPGRHRPCRPCHPCCSAVVVPAGGRHGCHHDRRHCRRHCCRRHSCATCALLGAAPCAANSCPCLALLLPARRTVPSLASRAGEDRADRRCCLFGPGPGRLCDLQT